MPATPPLTYEDEQELRRAAGEESQALKQVRKGSRADFLTTLGTAPGLTGAQQAAPRGGPQSTHTFAREGGSQYLDWSSFVNHATSIHANYGQQFPLSWLARQNPRDLEYLDSTVPGGTQWIIDAKNEALAIHESRILAEQGIDRTVEKLASFEEENLTHYQRRREEALAHFGKPTGEDAEGTFVERMQGGEFEGSPGTTVEDEQAETLMTALRLGDPRILNENPEERRERLRAWVEQNYEPTQERLGYWNYYFSSDGPASFMVDAGEFVATGMKGIIDLVDGLATLEAGTSDLIHEGRWNGVRMESRLDRAHGLQQEAFDQMVEEGTISSGFGDDLAAAQPGLVAQAKAEQIAPELLWETYKRENPEEAEDFLFGFAFGDEVLAQQGFFQLMRDQDEVQTALADLNQELSDQEWQMIEALREPDTAENIRASIATYGEWVEENGTYLASIFGEGFDMVASDAEAFNLAEIHRRASENRHLYGSASEYMGLQNTLSGIALDVFMWFPGDPLTFLGAPRLGLSAAKTFRASKVKRHVRGPRGTAELQDLVLVTRSGHRGETASVAMLDELDAIGLGDVFYAAAGGRNPTLPRGSWVEGPRGHAAVEVQAPRLAEDLGVATGKADPKLVEEIKAKGLDAPVTVHVNTADNVAWLDPDDVKVLAALDEIGEESVPLVLKQTEQTLEGATAADSVFGKSLDDLGWRTPGQFNPDGFASVRNSLPERTVYGDVDWEKLRHLQEKAHLLGAGSSSPRAAMVSMGIPEEVKHTFQQVQAGKAPWKTVRRWFSRDNVLTGYTWTGKNWNRQVRHTVYRLFGDNPQAAEGALREWRSILARRAQQSNRKRELKGQIAELRGRGKGYETRNLTPGGRNFGAAADDVAFRIEGPRIYQEALERPDDFVYHGTTTRSAEGIQRKGQTSGGFAKNREAAETYARNRREGGGSEVLVYRKSDLHPFQQRALEKSDELAEFGATGVPGIKPVARYNVDEGFESLARQADDIPPEAAGPAVRHKVSQADERALYGSIEDELARLEDELEKLGDLDNRELNDFMVRTWEKYNREVIAPTGKYKVDPDTGLVDWNDLRPGSRSGAYSPLNDGTQVYLPAGRQQALEGETFAGQTAESFALEKFGPLRNVQGWNAPISILDMHAAATLTRSQYLQYKSVGALDFMREMSHGALRMWKIDKVFRPATAMVATADELFRFFQTFGSDSWFRWTEDKVRQFSEYAVAAATPHKKGTRGYLNTDRVEHKIVGRWERRRQELADATPQQFRMQNRHFEEQYGEGFDVIDPKEAGHIEAAERWTSQALGDSGFRSAMKGDDAFNEWWNTHPDAEGLKAGSTKMPDGTMVPNRMLKNEILEGYRNFFDKVFMAGAKNTDRSMRAWLDTILRIDASGGSATAATLPKWALREVGPVTGVRTGAPGGNVLSKASNAMMDTLFMQPAKYRQQFLSVQIKKYEEKRLHTLLTDQGYRIVPDDVIEEITGGQFGITRHSQEWGDIAEITQQFSVVPESWIRRLAENKAVEEAEHLMYAWHKTSRIGRSIPGQAAVPFGGPWADMWGYYGREMLMPMVSRNVINKEALNLPKFADGVTNWLPGVKTAATISKFAATEFDASRGLVGGGEGFDLSPLFFLPTEGENAFMTMLPGFGAVPMIFLDNVIRAMADPLEEPERYQHIIDQVSEFVPPVGFQQQQAGRIFGGGHVATAAKLGSDLSGVFGLGYLTPLHDMIGDITVEQDATRNVRALFADPDNWNDLIKSTSGDEYDVHYKGLINEAFQRAAGSHGGETLLRQLVPARGDFDPSSDELLNVWLDAAEQYPDALAVPGLDALDPENAENAREVADQIRTKFWDLPQDERDLMVIQNPALAVNMVGGWAWTTSAEAKLPTESGVPYRSQGGHEGLARHQAFIKEGLIRPMAPGLLGHSILGTYFGARERQAKRIYSETVASRNEWVWENQVPDDWRQWFETQAQRPEIAEHLRDGTGQELWKNWTSLEQVYEEAWMRGTGVDPETVDEETKGTYNVVLPEDFESWSTQWRGLDDENFSKRFNNQPIPALPDDAIEILNVLGANTTPEAGITGTQLLEVIHQNLSDDVVKTPAKVRSAAEYGIYLNTRGQQSVEAEQVLEVAKINDNFEPEFRQGVDRLLQVRDQNQDIRNEMGRIPPDRMAMLRAEWNDLRVQGDTEDFDFDEIWKDLFQRDYGPQDWTPPEPPDGTENALAVQQIRTVLDGDTLVIRMADSDKLQKVRLLGVDAAEQNSEKGREQQKRLKQAIMNTVEAGGDVQIVPDTNATGGRYTDAYGRLLAWVFLDGEPYYFPDEVRP